MTGETRVCDCASDEYLSSIGLTCEGWLESLSGYAAYVPSCPAVFQ